MHHYFTETAKTAWSIELTLISHHSWFQQPCNDSCLQPLKNGIQGLVYGAYITGSRINGTSCAHVELGLDFGIALLLFLESGC
jgi:hypothetical protein